MTEHNRVHSPDIEAYFRRIGYTGSPEPTLETLRAIHYHHVTTIAFENITPLLQQPVRLDIPSLMDKLVHQGRGGYCFEQNGLLKHILTTLGYRVTGLAARVRWNVPDEVITPRSHMILRIDLEQPYIVDVGFGGQTLTGPVQLVAEVEQATPHEPFRFIATGAGYTLQALVGENWRTLYAFELQEQFPPDYEVSNWYVSTNPNSHFVTGLIAARPDHGRRYALRNNQLAVHSLEGESQQRTLATVAELRGVLENDFRLNLANLPGLDQRLQQLIDAAQ